MDKKMQTSVFVIAAPIWDIEGKVIGVLAGVTNLGVPNFIGKITDNSYGRTGGYILVSPQIRTIVYATNKNRIMEVLPAPGVNPLIDRFIQGYEGSGVVVNPHGTEVLASAKGIPASGWYIAALIPTEEAFAPVREMQNRMLLATIFLTLLAGGLTWWMLKRQLAPVFTAIKELAILSDTDSDQPRQLLPITRQDEIGELIGGFNHMLKNLGRREMEIHRLNAELEQRVTDRTALLEAANKELEAFCYSVSHDLRAPLLHIDGYVDLLVSRCSDGLTDKGLHYINTIADSARQMSVLIDDLLQFSRTGRQEMRRESLNMSQALQEALSPLKESNFARCIEWVIADLPSVSGDYALLRQVWANLLSNAVKYTRPREAARIEVSARKGNREIIFAVKDNGVGFDMQYSSNLFGVFQRLHSLEEFEGTGIGLATVQRIISRHGGRIWAEAELNQGATFYFSLPI
jgi:signal transduction histidine kinase